MNVTAKGFVFSIVCCLVSAAGGEYNPPERIMVVRPTFEGQTERPLRYRPENGDFVIRNGKEFFNRPLYGGNRAFRADAGDLPELSLYQPGQVGNVRFGIRQDDRYLWLHEARDVTARYRAGAMIYEIGDPLLGGAALRLSVVGLYDAEGVVVQIEQTVGSKPADVLIGYGGAGGKKGKRNGDIGCESEPVSQFFQLHPDNCKGNVFEIIESAFTLQSKPAQMGGAFSAGALLSIADAQQWAGLEDLAASVGQSPETPVLLASVPLRPGEPVYAVIKRMKDGDGLIASDELAEIYQQAEADRQAVAQQVIVETPDLYLNAAVAALCVAADAIWDESQGSVMHGAVAWRSSYCGWRGPYANDAFGWHDRAKRHLRYWAGRQNTKDFAGVLQGGDPKSNYARSHPSKQTSGDIGGKHYDMNLVYIDALIRHILWTGDLQLAEELWPVIERHMAWQRRLFRRTVGPDQLPLYEAYAAIWASDDLQYSGGGVTHASAYNVYHNRMMALIAERLGKDGSSYAKEADLIIRGMQKHLWLESGWYGEWKDLLGKQAVHPSAALWTFYHTIDSEAVDAREAWQMSRFVDTQIAHIPVHGDEIPEGRYYTLPTSSWMPYTWSTNNVVMAEVAHTALAYWQAGRPDKAMELFKGCILDSMYMGLCPGNAGMTTHFDMARGEAQRDFGDAVGMCSRAIVEGLFGIRPDLLSGELVVRPGLPEEWDYARLKHPNVTLDYQRKGRTESYAIGQQFGRDVPIRLIVPARSCQVKTLTVNDKTARWTSSEGIGRPLIEICAEGPGAYIAIEWSGKAIDAVDVPAVIAEGMPLEIAFGAGRLTGLSDPQQVLSTYTMHANRLEAMVSNVPGHRTVFAERRLGELHWTEPLSFEVRPRYEIVSIAEQAPETIRFRVRNNMAESISGPVEFDINGRGIKRKLKIKAHADSDEIVCPAEEFELLPGTTRITAKMADGCVFEGTVTNWKIHCPAAARDRLEPVSVAFNDRLTQIFRNEYLSPRSPYCSLSIPKQGIGSWCNFEKTFVVDDGGLRKSAGQDGLFQLPFGIPFSTPGQPDASNVLFVSQWDNYPNESVVELSGKARHVYLLMAGSTNSMQSRFDNGFVTVDYADGSSKRLALNNPVNWWPIDQDYFIDDFGFRRPEAVNPRVHLKTGRVVIADPRDFGGQGITVDGGAANVLDLPLRPDKELRSLRVSAEANEVIIGLISVTLVR
jgi:hypothetical protein